MKAYVIEYDEQEFNRDQCKFTPTGRRVYYMGTKAAVDAGDIKNAKFCPNLRSAKQALQWVAVDTTNAKVFEVDLVVTKMCEVAI